jgi:hypothetical protein
VKALEKSLNAILQKFNDLTNQTTQVQTQERTDHGEKSGVSLSSEFVIAVKELIQNLITVALYHDRIINSNIAYDPATLVDFYYNIAKGSSDSPDLRISWLLNIAKLQLDVQTHTHSLPLFELQFKFSASLLLNFFDFCSY